MSWPVASTWARRVSPTTSGARGSSIPRTSRRTTCSTTTPRSCPRWRSTTHSGGSRARRRSRSGERRPPTASCSRSRPTSGSPTGRSSMTSRRTSAISSHGANSSATDSAVSCSSARRRFATTPRCSTVSWPPCRQTDPPTRWNFATNHGRPRANGCSTPAWDGASPRPTRRTPRRRIFPGSPSATSGCARRSTATRNSPSGRRGSSPRSTPARRSFATSSMRTRARARRWQSASRRCWRCHRGR